MFDNIAAELSLSPHMKMVALFVYLWADNLQAESWDNAPKRLYAVSLI